MIPDRHLLNLARSSRGPLLLAVVLGWLGGVLVIIQALLLSRIMTGVFLERQTLEALLPWMVGLLGVFLCRSGVQYAGEMAAHHASSRIRLSLRRSLLEHIFMLGPAYSQDEQSGEQAAVILQGVDDLDAYFSQYLPQVALAALIPFSVLLVAFPIEWLSALVLMLTAPLIPIFMVLIGQASAAVTRRQFHVLGRMSAFLLDTIQGLTTLKLLNQSAAQVQRIARVSEDYRKTTLRVLRVAFLSALVLELVGTLSTAVIAVQIGLRLLDGSLFFEQAFFVLLLAPEFYLPLRLLGLRFHAAETGHAAARRILAVLEIPLPQPGKPAEAAPQAPLRIEFCQVAHVYANRPESALKDISFTLQPGKVTALVGASGSGKSTLAAMLLGFIQPQQGEITANGVNLSSLAAETWRTRVTWLPQRAHIFHATIAENLRIAKKNASLEELRQAASHASLDVYLGSLPAAFETVVGEGGLALSGGQAQRLALARAFLSSAPLLIVDEPAAWLDAELESALSASLNDLARNRTVLMIAHRLASVMQADWVVVLDAGCIAEQGSPVQLTQQGGVFSRLIARGGELP